MRALATCALVGAVALPQAGMARAMVPDEDTVDAAGLRCVQRVAIPGLDNVIDAKWSPDGWTLAVVRFVRTPSARNVSGYQEEEVLETLDLRSGKVGVFGEGDRPAWSDSGRYLAYWGPKADYLLVMERGEVVARLTPSIPEFRWSGDTLIYIERTTIRAWTGRSAGTIVKLVDRYVPHYPRDDVYWSGDGSRFTLTRYTLDEPEAERFVGWTEMGDVAPLDVPGAMYTEWAPRGAILLIRYPARLEIRDETGLTRASIPIARGALHSWGPDGRTLLLRTPRPTVAGGEAFEEVRVVWPASRAATATLPNVVGARAFSPDSRSFSGMVRTDRHDDLLQVYRCVDVKRGDLGAPDPEAPARLAKIDAGTGRLIRPAAGDIAQFMQGSHTGIDIAAPIGSLIVAADDGVVGAVGWMPNGGNRVCVQHAAGLESCYLHTSAALVSVGERVARGQPIALVGMTGLTTGPHVHWETKLFGRLVDPLAR